VSVCVKCLSVCVYCTVDVYSCCGLTTKEMIRSSVDFCGY